MDKLTAVRIGKINAETITDENETTETINYPIPIVFWNKFNKSEGALYFRVVNEANDDFKQKIDYLYSPNHGMTGRLRSLFDVYPLTYKDRGFVDKKDLRDSNFIDYLYTKDINGDGVDELILTRGLGGVEVYDREKLIFSYKPDVQPQLFKYSTERAFHAAFDHHDEMLMVGYRTPYESFFNSTPDYRVIRVYPEGIKEITPTFLDNKRPKTIETAACISRSESKDMDELILITTFEDMDGYYLSRHTPEGKALDTPRKIYAEGFNPAYYTFRFVPQSNQVIAHSHDAEKLYFITPEKQVNWFKSVNLDKLQADRTTGLKSSTVIIGQARIKGIPAVMIDNDNTLYVIDANGKYHSSINSESKSDKPVVFATIKPLSDHHEIMTIRTLDQRLDRLLVIQSRSPGCREVSLEELETAGERFLPDSKWKDCKDELQLEFDENTPKYIRWYCGRKKIQIPEIHSLEDIKNKLPGYYEELVKDAKDRYQISLNNRLYGLITSKGAQNINRLDDDDNYSAYKNKEEFKKWLANVFIAPELVVSIHHLSDGTVTTQKLADFYFTYLDDNGMASTQDHINIRASGDHGQAFLVLQQKTLEENFKPAYYTIVW